jgi:hypothetical protein
MIRILCREQFLSMLNENVDLNKLCVKFVDLEDEEFTDVEDVNLGYIMKAFEEDSSCAVLMIENINKKTR